MSRLNRHARSSSPVFAEIEELLHDLESKLNETAGRGSSAASAASSYVGDAVAEALADMSDRLRGGAHVVKDRAARAGTDALSKIEDEVERRPLAAVAIAAGIGFLLGAASTSHRSN